MEAIPKSDIKSVIKSDISFDISIKKPTTWIGHKVCILSISFVSSFSLLKILSLSVIGRQQSQQQEQAQHERLSRQATIDINIMLTITGRKVWGSKLGFIMAKPLPYG